MTQRVVQISPDERLDTIFSSNNPHLSTHVYESGKGAVEIKNWSHSLDDAQRQDGRPGPVDLSAPFAPGYMEEQVERRLLLLADPMYKFVRLVAGFTGRPVENVRQLKS